MEHGAANLRRRRERTDPEVRLRQNVEEAR
jgi:hypothetical protein